MSAGSAPIHDPLRCPECAVHAVSEQLGSGNTGGAWQGAINAHGEMGYDQFLREFVWKR